MLTVPEQELALGRKLRRIALIESERHVLSLEIARLEERRRELADQLEEEEGELEELKAVVWEG